MKQSTLAVGIMSFGIVGAIAMVSGVYAFTGQGGLGAGATHDPARHEAMTQAFEKQDYAAWKELMGDRGAAKKVTAEEFPRFVEMHNLKVAGKTDEANKIRQELGLGTGQGKGQGRHINGERGQNRGGNFVDANGNGVCDRME
jgi:hypothetical protein